MPATASKLKELLTWAIPATISLDDLLRLLFTIIATIPLARLSDNQRENGQRSIATTAWENASTDIVMDHLPPTAAQNDGRSLLRRNITAIIQYFGWPEAVIPSLDKIGLSVPTVLITHRVDCKYCSVNGVRAPLHFGKQSAVSG